MAYPPRSDFPDAIHHVFARGNDKQPVFRDELDRIGFLSELAATVEQYDWRLYVWCLMGNHFHLLFKTPEPTLSQGMRRLLRGYAGRFNQRYSRSGHLFKARFGSVLVEEDRQFQTVCRYILRNPVEARLVDRVQDWRWNSYAASLSDGYGRVPLDRAGLWSFFGSTPQEACYRMADFVNAPAISDSPQRPPLYDLQTRYPEPQWMVRAHREHNYSIGEIADFAAIHRTTVWRRINATSGATSGI